MRFLSPTGGNWRVTLNDGSVLWVWADGYERFGDVYSFGLLIDAEGEADESIDITNTTPRNPNRVVVSVLRLPVALVAEIDGGGSQPPPSLLAADH